jgi:large subunit ribosomal protein L6
MSRIGKLPITIPKGVTIAINGNTVKVKGPKGELTRLFADGITVGQEGETLKVARASDEVNHKSLHGLSRTLLANMVEGVTKGYQKTLEINGVGYKAEIKGTKVVLSLGFSHPIEYQLPEGITAKVDKNLLILSGIDRQQLGAATAKIRSFRPPEPYKGKGIKYVEETILRKAGKTAGK